MANDILTFCGTDTGTNLLTQSEYNLSTDRTSGNKPGIASAKLVNKSLRQSAAVASQMAQFVSNKTGTDIVDNGVYAQLLAQFTSALTSYPPKITTYTSGTGTHSLTYIFAIATGSATIGATYTNNGNTFTIAETVASGVEIKATGNGDPLVAGTLTKSGGTGDTTLTFYARRAPVALQALVVGGGGGGAGSGSGSPTNGSAGGNSTFGTTLLVANGGGGGVANNGAGGTGGTASLGTGPIGTALNGADGQPGCAVGPGPGGNGGVSSFGGNGWGGFGKAGTAATTNSGSGGGGAGTSAGANPSGGGGSGALVDAIISGGPLAAGFPYAVGGGGAGGVTGGSFGFNGGAGSAGYIRIMEIYQ